jgi:hypothetical protein
MSNKKAPSDEFNEKKEKPVKKRRFLERRLPNTLRGNLLILPLTALIAVDGGLSMIVFMAGMHGVMSAGGAPDDAYLNKVLIVKNDAQQNIKAGRWAHELRDKIQNMIYDAPDKKNTKKHLKKAFKLAQQLEEHLTVVDAKGHEIKDEKPIYLKTRPEVVTKVIIKDEDKLSSQGKQLKPKKNKGFDL